MPKPLDRAALRARLHQLLAVEGASPASALCARLGISQPSFSRLVRQDPRVVRIGAGQATRWVLHRRPSGHPGELPIHRIDPQGRPVLAARLTLLHRDEHLVHAPVGSATHLGEDLPWFLEDLRPSGYLGRLLPRRHPELDLPGDIRRWNHDDVLRYLVHQGVDAPGDLVVGDAALGRIYEGNQAIRVRVSERPERYPAIAADVLGLGAAGSSAAGEQPKFTALRHGDGGTTAVLVKFSPPEEGPVSRRIADLLVAEHLAHQALSTQGWSACSSSLLQAGGRTFLEVERFDRTPRGRRGVVSLNTLDAGLAGTAGSWLEAAAALARLGRIPEGAVEEVRRLALFGQLIGNTDMHLGNLSFFRADDLLTEGRVGTALAPAYDMLPMAFAPVAGHLVAPAPPLPPPFPRHREVFDLAARYWRSVVEDPRISSDFTPIAAEMGRRVEERAAVLR